MLPYQSQQNPLTKALDNSQVGATAPIDPSKALIVYFMDASSSTVASYKLTGAQITAIQSGSGFKFTNLDPSVVNVYVVANVHSSTLPVIAPGTTLTAINNTVQNIYDQQTANAASVVLANKDKAIVSTGSTTGTASNGNLEFKAAIELAAIVSRIQIASITKDGTITGFNLAGIYIDNFYQNMSIGGDLTSIIKATAGNVADFKLSAEGSVTPYKINGQLFDEIVSPTTTLPLAPSGKVYGYQIFPVAGGLSTVPYIILKLTNVVGTTRTFPNTAYYIAVKAYKDGATSFTSFEAGKIYTIASIPVSENNIVTDPTQSLINVTVNVTIAPWTDKALNPDFGY